MLALAAAVPASAQTLGALPSGQPLSQTALYSHEQFADTYRPIRDRYLSGILGVGVNLFLRGPGHPDLGYAEPDAQVKAIDLSQTTYEWIYALRAWANQGLVTAQMALAAYVLAHELGHLNSSDRHNEDQANAWAAAHFTQVLSSLGLKAAARRQVFRLARLQLLV